MFQHAFDSTATIEVQLRVLALHLACGVRFRIWGLRPRSNLDN